MLLDRVVEWHKAEVVTTGAKAKGKRRGTSTRPAAAKGDDAVGGGTEENAAAAAAGDAEQAERVGSVWALLAKTGEGDAQKCLKKVRE